MKMLIDGNTCEVYGSMKFFLRVINPTDERLMELLIENRAANNDEFCETIQELIEYRKTYPYEPDKKYMTPESMYPLENIRKLREKGTLERFLKQTCPNMIRRQIWLGNYEGYFMVERTIAYINDDRRLHNEEEIELNLKWMYWIDLIIFASLYFQGQIKKPNK